MSRTLVDFSFVEYLLRYKLNFDLNIG